jgi:hypothetical protein
LGVVGQAGVDGGGQIGGDGCFKAVVTVIGVLPMAGRGQVAVGIVSGWEVGLTDACDAGVLVQAVAGVAGGGIGLGGARPLVQVVVPSALDDLLGLVAGVAVVDVLGGASQVMRQAGQAALGAVGVAGTGAIAQGDEFAPGQVVVGVASQVDAAVFMQDERAV